jgi:hypothetical protein
MRPLKKKVLLWLGLGIEDDPVEVAEDLVVDEDDFWL